MHSALIVSRVRRESQRLLDRAATIWATRGIGAVVRQAWAKAIVVGVCPVLKLLYGGRTFKFHGVALRLWIHPYNCTWRNERCIEIAVAKHFVKGVAGECGVEVGNVLSHYWEVSHTVIDRYEKAPGVINEDIVVYETDARFDYAIAVSTLEHVGQDEDCADPKRALVALQHLRGLLKPNGRLLVTCPLGHNIVIDEVITAGNPAPIRSVVLARRSAFEWSAISRDEARNYCEYNRASLRANAVWIAEFGSLQAGSEAQ